MNVWALRAAGAAVLAGLLWQFPLLRVVRLSDQAAAAPQDEVVDPSAYAQDFWASRLHDVEQAAAPAADAIAALQRDPAAAKQEFGRAAGVGRSFYVLVQGEGAVAAVDKKGVRLRLDDSEIEVRLAGPPYFGNAIRDASGLIGSEEFPSSRGFNELSRKLNELAEQQVAARLSELEPGAHLRFVGCAKVTSQPTAQKPLTLQLVRLEVQ